MALRKSIEPVNCGSAGAFFIQPKSEKPEGAKSKRYGRWETGTVAFPAKAALEAIE
jgi:hypothetical protein